MKGCFRAGVALLVLTLVLLIPSSGARVGAQIRPLTQRPPQTKQQPSAARPAQLPPRVLAAAKVSPEMRGMYRPPRTCELEIQRELSTDGYMHYEAIERTTWNWDHASKIITFRWRDTNPRTVAVAWQVSRLRYGNGGKEWEFPPGLVAHGKVPRQAEWTTVDVNFGQFAPLPGGKPTSFTLPKGIAAMKLPTGQQKAAPQAKVPAGPPKLAAAKPASTPAKASGEAGVRARAVATAQAQLINGGIVSFFVRAVPLDAQGKLAGYGSLPIEVAWGPQPGAINVDYSLSTPPPANHPVVTIAQYTPIYFSQHPYNFMCVQDVLGFQKGKVYDFTPRPKSGLDEFLASWGDLFGFIAQVYDWVAQGIDVVKGNVIDIVVAAINQLPGNFGEDFRGVAAFALDAGLTAMGVPPDLPSLDELADMGQGYLAKRLAEEVPGLPEDAAKEAVKALADQARQVAQTGGGAPGMLFIPDPADRYRPATLQLLVRNPSNQPTTPMDLTMEFSEFTPPWKDIGDMTGLYFPDGLKPMKVFRDHWGVHLPSLQPGETMTVPIALQETYSLRQPDQNNFRWSCWAWGYHSQQHVTIATRLLHPKKGPENRKEQLSIDFVPDAKFAGT